MKKTLLVLCSIAVLAAIAISLIGVYICSTPQHALMKTLEDVNESGMEGLRPHLTARAQDNLDSFFSLPKNLLLHTLIGLLKADDNGNFLASEFQKIQWNIDHIVKDHSSALVVLAFNYDNKLVGTIDLSMVQDAEGWKIDGMNFPELDEITFRLD